MNRSKIIQHYKSFFDIEDMGLAENDHLMIDWAESLVKDCNLHIVNGSALTDSLGNEVIVSKNMTTEQWNTAIKHHINWIKSAAEQAANELEQHYR